MQQLPESTIAGARELLAAGWTPSPHQAGRVDAPLGAQPTSAHLVPHWTWAAMTLMQLADDPGKVWE
jgi:hypothetical protein